MQRLDIRYRDWLESLDVGSPVAVVCSSSIGKYKITTVESVDRLRRNIKVKCNNDIFVDGDNGESLLGDNCILQPITAEIREYVHREKLIDIIKNTDLKVLSTGRLESLVELLE